MDTQIGRSAPLRQRCGTPSKLVTRVTWVHARSMSPDNPQHGEDRRLAEDRAWARWALSRWESFPVGRDPRPLVMAWPLTWFEGGFRSSEAKLAFLYGDIEATVPLPRGMLGLLREGESGPLPDPRERRWSSPLLITEASSGSAAFHTDRGRREFPAWRLGGPDVDGHFWILDPAVAARRWKPPQPAPPRPFDGQPHRSGSAVIEHDGRTLRFTFTGGVPTIFEYPAAEVMETGQAVVVLPVEQYVGPPGPGFVAMVGCGRTVSVTLDRPLGRRVVVDLDATPITVLATELVPAAGSPRNHGDTRSPPPSWDMRGITRLPGSASSERLQARSSNPLRW